MGTPVPNGTATPIPTVNPIGNVQNPSPAPIVTEQPITPIVKQSKVTTKSVQVKWDVVEGADSYRVYYAVKGKKLKKYKEIKASKKKLKLKKLKKGKYYKVRVCAYKNIDGKMTLISTSPDTYIATKGGKYGNPTKIKLKTKTLSVDAEKKSKIKAKLKTKGNTDFKKLTKKIRYMSSDTSVATVSKKGKVTGVSKGSCVIYCYTQNGKTKKVKVTVN